MNKKCMCPSCVNYDKTAKGYCCNACSCNHHDRLKLYEDKGNTTLEIVACLETAEKIVPSNIGMKRVWGKVLTDMREAIRLQKKNDLNVMIACFKTLEKTVPSDIEVKKVWFMTLVSLRETIKLQEKIDKN